MNVVWGLVCVWLGMTFLVLWPSFISARHEDRHAQRWGVRRCSNTKCRICTAWEARR